MPLTFPSIGSMGKAVEFQLQYLKEGLSPGDVILSNHPLAGGLPFIY